jgi:hypothetical protein
MLVAGRKTWEGKKNEPDLDVIRGRKTLVPAEDLQRQTKDDGDVAPATGPEELVEVDEGGETECGEGEPGEAFRRVV